jgi:hypothetical protein
LFLNTNANQYVTPDLATLIGSKPYLGNDHLHVGDGKGLSISNIGHTTLHTLKHTFTLSNVLHVPHIIKPLLSVHKFYVIIISILNFMSLCFMLRISTPRYCSFLVRATINGFYVLFKSSSMSIP